MIIRAEVARGAPEKAGLGRRDRYQQHTDPRTRSSRGGATTPADLIAMMTHARVGLGCLVFGSATNAVLRTAPDLVFLVRLREAE
jgi:nucleotide-binding universal stress UspA family protein